MGILAFCYSGSSPIRCVNLSLLLCLIITAKPGKPLVKQLQWHAIV